MIECCVNLCPSNSSDGEVSFYRFPVIRSDGNRQSSIERRSAWIRVVGRKNIDWDLAVVCSRHFASGRPSQLYEHDNTDWVPSLELNGEGLKRVRKVVVEPRASPTTAVVVEDGAAPHEPKQSILGSLLLARSTNPPFPKVLLKDPFEETIRTSSTKICRLCLGKEVRLTRPFQDDSGPDDSLLQKIYECTTVKITLKASYPASICAICDSKLSEYSKFREKCIENDELLRTILDGDSACQEKVVVPVEANDAPNTSIRPVEYQESNEIRDLQLQLYGSSDENTVSQSEFVGSDGATVAPLPKITSVTSNAPIDTSASPSVVQIGTKSPAVDESPKPDKVATPPPKPTISVKPLSSLAATTSEVSSKPTASDSAESSASKEVEKVTAPANYGSDGRLECTICARPFRNSYTLRRHMNLHTEENLYTCEYCAKKFNDRSNWKIHLRAHTGDNLLRCLVCFKTFISPSTLKYHLRAHRKLKVFECRFCVETATTYETLSEHIAAKHGDVRLEDYTKISEESFMAGDFLKIEMEADETTLTVTVPRSNAESSEAGSETTLQLPPLIPAPPGAVASISQSKGSSDEVVRIKEEILDPDEIEIKQEPMDDDTLGSMAMDAGHTQVQQQLTALIPPADEESPPVILFRCDYCMKIFKYLYELRVHMRIHNGAKVTEKSSPVKPPPAKKPRHPSIDEDVGELEHAPLPEHQCDKCEKCFRTEELLRVHIETHKMDENVTMARSCKICLKTFKCELNLVSHMRKHHIYESYVADQQQQEQDQQKAASVEEKPQSPDSSSNEGGNQSQGESVDTSSTAEGGGSTTTRKCEICAFTFDCAYKLEQHMMTHFKNNEAVAFLPSADRPYKCTECHKRFKRKDYLLIHIRTHTGERRHKCDMCSSAFVHPSNLITHRKLHSNERPFKCDLCPAAFKLFAGLKIHRKRCVLKYLQENSVTVAD
ncbi:zinc finger protein 271-like isoform X2 [Ochlerotatus camptorhynchus]|uniref:zinc finger protein 271-like isoform X2 n=1 Tax=Ochlerotatus camptorhynchus TaxID=644619 RepID=UPI0031DEB1D3